MRLDLCFSPALLPLAITPPLVESFGPIGTTLFAAHIELVQKSSAVGDVLVLHQSPRSGPNAISSSQYITSITGNYCIDIPYILVDIFLTYLCLTISGFFKNF
jgi:hypothetical protein